jgi:hypothetical protein
MVQRGWEEWEMAIRTETLTDGSIVVELDDMDAWEDFAAQNRDALCDQYGSTEKAFRHAIDGGLLLGGGAAPAVSVYFAD